MVRADAVGSRYHCKKVYLDDSGKPKLFNVSEILANIDTTGGLNVGRKASKIGDPKEGWIVTGLLHPWCRCVPMPAVKGTVQASPESA